MKLGINGTVISSLDHDFSDVRCELQEITIILPGEVHTNSMSNSGLVTKEEEAKSKERNGMKALAADKAAAIMIKGIEGNQFRVLVGSDARFLDFLYRLAPRFAVNFIVKQMAKLKKK